MKNLLFKIRYPNRVRPCIPDHFGWHDLCICVPDDAERSEFTVGVNMTVEPPRPHLPLSYFTGVTVKYKDQQLFVGKHDVLGKHLIMRDDTLILEEAT
jgi:hypothetical protein